MICFNTGNASLSTKSPDEVKEKEIKTGNVKKLLTCAASAIMTAAALGKRRRAERDQPVLASFITDSKQNTQAPRRCHAATSATATASTATSSHPVSTAHSNIPRAVDPVIPKGDDVAQIPSISGNAVPTKTLSDSPTCEEDDSFERDSDNNSIVKKMRVEIIRLQEENVELLNEQFTRETEIRVEVRFRIFVTDMMYDTHTRYTYVLSRTYLYCLIMRLCVTVIQHHTSSH